MDIMPLVKIVGKWARRVAIAGPEYEDGLRNPRRDWEAATLAAEDTWEAAIAEAIRLKLWSAGVREAGTAKWRTRSLELGTARWRPGVTVAQPDYSAGFEPFHRALEALTLPPRYAKGDERNFDRVIAIGKELHRVKRAMAKR